MLQQESKKEQFLRHVAALNKSFFAWFTDLTQDKDKGKDGIDFIDGFQVFANNIIFSKSVIHTAATITTAPYHDNYSALYLLLLTVYKFICFLVVT